MKLSFGLILLSSFLVATSIAEKEGTKLARKLWWTPLPTNPLDWWNGPQPPKVHNCYTYEVWTPEKTEWCCNNLGLGCHLAEQHDCYSRDRWSPVKTEWCCANRGLGCPQERFDCAARDWSPEKDKWCCENLGLGCPQERHNCYSRDRWSPAKKEWCCNTMGRGCEREERHNCPLPRNNGTFGPTVIDPVKCTDFSNGNRNDSEQCVYDNRSKARRAGFTLMWDCVSTRNCPESRGPFNSSIQRVRCADPNDGTLICDYKNPSAARGAGFRETDCINH